MHQAASFVFQEKALAKTTGNVDILFIGTYKKKKIAPSSTAHYNIQSTHVHKNEEVTCKGAKVFMHN